MKIWLIIIVFEQFIGSSSIGKEIQIGYARDATVKILTHNTTFDDGVPVSLHLADDSTDYQNTTGNTVYATVTVKANVSSGSRADKIYSAPTTDTVSGATEVWDSLDMVKTTVCDANESVTSWLLPIQNNHYIVVENTSGTSSRPLEVDAPATSFRAFVIEQAP